MNIATVTGTCPECKQKFSSVTQGGLNRAIGYHLRVIHHKAGLTTTLEGKRKIARLRHYRLAGLNEKQVAEREAAYQEKHKAQQAIEAAGGTSQPVKKKKSNTIEPLMVSRCPKCGMEFLGRKDGGAPGEIMLPFCPDCGIRFYFAE